MELQSDIVGFNWELLTGHAHFWFMVQGKLHFVIHPRA